MNTVPIVRHFIACSAIEQSDSGRGVTLRELVHAIVRLPGEPFPCVRDKIALFALLTDGRGRHEFTIELTRLEQGTERLVSPAWGPAHRELGQDPTIVHGFPILLTNVVFHEAGQYSFHLLCDGQKIAEEKVLVR